MNLLKAFKYIFNSKYRFMKNASLGMYNTMSDDEYLKRWFKARMKKRLNLLNPQTFNEKLQWLKLYNRKPEYTMMVDKYKVREYIAEQLGEEYLIPLLGVWDNPDDINFDTLPNQFVLKCNHNSGLGMCICKDKSKLDVVKVKNELRKGLAQDYYLTGREWPYKDVPHKIIAEKYMVDEGLDELRDYKFFCFGGLCKCMKVDFDRFIEHRANYFDPQGNIFDLGETVCPPDKSKNIVLPKNMDKMVELAEELSKNIPFLRVDFYDVNGKIYFGELTFFPASGFGTFVNENSDLELGNWIELPEKSGGYCARVGEFIVVLSNNKQKDLVDFKFFCFDGDVKYCQVIANRSTNETIDFFDMEWNLQPFIGLAAHQHSKEPIAKPKNLSKMIEICKTLSQGMPFVRIDLYEINGKVYFGEITFFPASGFGTFKPDEWNYKMGDLIKLSK